MSKEVQKGVVDPVATLFNQRKKALENFLGDERNAMKFLSSVMHSVQKNPKLRECRPDTLLGAFFEAAALRLYPDTAQQHCHVLPYKGVATFIMGYRGYKELAYRAGISACGAEVVHENDTFKEVSGTSPRIDHNKAEGDRGNPVKVYAWAKYRGDTLFTVLTREEVMRFKGKSPSKNSKFSPWYEPKEGKFPNDPMFWMWKKTAFKQLAKMLPSCEEIERAVQVDNVAEMGGHLADEERHIVEAPIETVDEKVEEGEEKKSTLRKKRTVEKKPATAQDAKEVFEGEVVEDPAANADPKTGEIPPEERKWNKGNGKPEQQTLNQ